jgi:hypothetical protein
MKSSSDFAPNLRSHSLVMIRGAQHFFRMLCDIDRTRESQAQTVPTHQCCALAWVIGAEFIATASATFGTRRDFPVGSAMTPSSATVR